MAINENMFLQKEYYEGHDLLSGKVVSSMKISLSAMQLQQGLIKELGWRNFAVLMAIASFINKENISYPTVEKLTEITGMTKPTVIKAVKELETATIGGEKLIKKTKVLTSEGNTKSLYHFIHTLKDEEIAVTPAEHIATFCKFFEEKYGRPYVPNYGRDTKQIKDNLMAVMPEEDIPLIIEIAVKQYEQWSSNPKYPTPSIGALVTWLGNRAADELARQRKAVVQVEKKIQAAGTAEQLNPLDLLDM